MFITEDIILFFAAVSVLVIINLIMGFMIYIKVKDYYTRIIHKCNKIMDHLKIKDDEVWCEYEADSKLCPYGEFVSPDKKDKNK